jgi:hypothetical protein
MTLGVDTRCRPRTPTTKCEPTPYSELLEKISAMETEPENPLITEMYDVLKSKLKIDRIYSIEADHCYEAHSCVIESKDW